MSRRCELTGKAVQVGHLVSHSNRKTKTRFLPNLCSVSLISDALGRTVRLRIAAAALRSVEHRGGLDAFLLKAEDEDLSAKTRALKREIAKKQPRPPSRPQRPPEPARPSRPAQGSAASLRRGTRDSRRGLTAGAAAWLSRPSRRVAGRPPTPAGLSIARPRG